MIPVGHYAVAVQDDEDEDGNVLGYQVFARRRAHFTAVGLYVTDGADRDAARAASLTMSELIAVVAIDPAWFQQEFGRFAGKCGICGRTLTDPNSKTRGIGPECWRARQ